MSPEAKQPLTRSKTSPYNRDVCFFSDGERRYRQPLHTVSTLSAGSSLNAAVKKEGDEKKLHVKLSTAVDSRDAHAIDIKYHKNCWTKHVTNVLRKHSTTSNIEQASEVAAKIEFVTMAEMALKSGKIMNMSQLQASYDTISQENNVKVKTCSRRAIKKLIQAEIEDVEFHKPKRVNELERVSIKESRDVTIQLSETAKEDCTSNIKTCCTPELARLAEQAKKMAGVSSKSQGHHNLTIAVLVHEELGVAQLTATIERFTNPFSDTHTDLFNLVTKVVMPETVKEDLCEQSEIGRRLFDCFVKERVQSGKVNLWLPMKKRKLLTWKTSAKVVKVTAADEIAELQEDRSLLARVMMVCKSRPEIDIKETVGQYEFSIVPRSLFAADCTMLHCASKSNLMSILEKLNGNRNHRRVAGPNEDQMKVATVDGMAEVQSLYKPKWIRNCALQLAEHFSNRVMQTHNGSNEVRLIFDRYDLPFPLKG